MTLVSIATIGLLFPLGLGVLGQQTETLPPVRQDTLVFTPLSAGSPKRLRQAVISADIALEPTFCVVTRVYKPEMPYLRSFLRHYRSIGVRKFYAFNNFYDEHEKLLQIMGNFTLDAEVTIVLRSLPNEADADALINELGIDFVSEDWVIGVDVDEFWVLPDGIKTLPELVEARPATHYQVPWVIVPNGAIAGYRHHPYEGLPGHAGKWMARRTAMSKLTGQSMHEPAMIKSPENVRLGASENQRWWTAPVADEVGNLVHFWGRSFQDMLLKQLVQRGMNRKASWVTGQLSADWALPTRLATLAFFESQRGPWVHVDPGYDIFVPDRELEARLTAEAMGHAEDGEPRMPYDQQLQTLHAAYEAVRGQLSAAYYPILGAEVANPNASTQLAELCSHGMAAGVRSDCPHYPEWTVSRIGGYLTYHMERTGVWDDAVETVSGQ